MITVIERKTLPFVVVKALGVLVDDIRSNSVPITQSVQFIKVARRLLQECSVVGTVESERRSVGGRAKEHTQQGSCLAKSGGSLLTKQGRSNRLRRE